MRPLGPMQALDWAILGCTFGERGSFTLKPRAIKRACRWLGIDVPSIDPDQDHVDSFGNTYDDGTITLLDNQPAWLASAVLWHELTHVVQMRRAGDPQAWHRQASKQVWDLYFNVPALHGRALAEKVAALPFECEAYWMMNQHFLREPLAS